MTTQQKQNQLRLLEGKICKIRRNRKQLLAELEHLSGEEVRLTAQCLDLKLSPVTPCNVSPMPTPQS